MKILATSDWHLSTIRPVCRVDSDWVRTQESYITAIREHMKDVNTLVIAGDVFDTPTVSPVMVNMVVKLLKDYPRSICLAGNHDLPYHSVERINESSFGIVRTINNTIDTDFLFDFGTEKESVYNNTLVALHAFTVPDTQSKVPNMEQYTAQDLCAMYPNTKVIVVGDNHMPWSKRIGNQLVVNCGTLIQRTAAEAKRPCGFYIVDTDELSAEYVDLSDLSDNCIDLSYLDDIKERTEHKVMYEGLLNEIRGNKTETYDFIDMLQEITKAHRKTIDSGTYNVIEETIAYIKENA